MTFRFPIGAFPVGWIPLANLFADVQDQLIFSGRFALGEGNDCGLSPLIGRFSGNFSHDVQRETERLQLRNEMFERGGSPKENAKYRLTTSEEVYAAVWWICQHVTEVGVLLDSGSVTKMDRSLVQYSNPLACDNAMISIIDGRIKTEMPSSGWTDDKRVFEGVPKDLRGLAVLLNAKEVHPLKKELELLPSQVAGATPQTVSGVARALVESFDAGTYINKDVAKETLAPDISKTRFKSAWANAVIERPKLSKSGRKPKAKPS